MICKYCYRDFAPNTPCPARGKGYGVQAGICLPMPMRPPVRPYKPPKPKPKAKRRANPSRTPGARQYTACIACPVTPEVKAEFKRICAEMGKSQTLVISEWIDQAIARYNA